MAITLTSTLDASVATLYEKDFLSQKRKTQVWAQQPLVNWLRPLQGGVHSGSSVQIPMIEEMALATTALTESSDVTPVALSDRYITLTPYEQGNVVQTTKMLDLEAYTDVGKMAAIAIGQNQARSIDRLVRDAAVGGTWVFYVVGATTRTDLDTTNDLLTFSDLMVGVAHAKNASVPEFDGGFVAIANPLVIAGLAADSAWLNVQYNQLGGTGILNGEVGKLAGVRFVSHEYGKLYLGGGAALNSHSATTITEPLSAGDTTATTTTTNLQVGGYVTIGTLEAANTEQVMVTAIGTGTIAFRGEGNTATNFGCKYAHADNSALTYAANAAGIVLIGANSLYGAYASDPGKDGNITVEWAKTNIPNRFMNHSWYWIGGFARNEHSLLRIECAALGGILGDN